MLNGGIFRVAARVAQHISFSEPSGQSSGSRVLKFAGQNRWRIVGMKRYLVAPLALLVIGAAAQTFAHHSFAATYLENQTVTIEGELVQFVLRNPHSFVDVDVTEKDGTKTRYVVEWAAPAQLAGKVDRDTLKPGDHVVITGSPGRNTEDHRVRLLTFRRPKDANHATEWSWGLLPEETFK